MLSRDAPSPSCRIDAPGAECPSALRRTKGKKKMLKKMQKYWRSPLAEVKSLDYKPKGAAWTPPKDLEANLQAMAEYVDPREECDENNINNTLTPEQEQELRDKLAKTEKKDD